MEPTSTAVPRRLLTAEILAVGTEITSGETRDTNSGELARSLVTAGVEVGRMAAVPDRRGVVEEAFRAALDRVDLVVATGGLGPTPDDLTRESIAAICGETPTVDPELETWLRGLWERRGLPFAEMNLKQAWTIPSARPLANPNGTAPGWWVDRPDGRVIVVLPGPPREMRPMWRDEVLPRLNARGLGADRAVRTLRLTGIGESLLADRLGDELLRRENPEVATYARSDAVDVRMSATAIPAVGGRPARTAEELLDDVEPVVLAAVGEHVWARDQTTWAEAIDAELERAGWTLATREHGTGGALVGLLGVELAPRPGGDPARTPARRRPARSRRRGTRGRAGVRRRRGPRRRGSLTWGGYGGERGRRDPGTLRPPTDAWHSSAATSGGPGRRSEARRPCSRSSGTGRGPSGARSVRARPDRRSRSCRAPSG